MRQTSRVIRLPSLAGFVLLALGCGAGRTAPRQGFWFPDEGRVVDLTRRAGEDPRVTTMIAGSGDGSLGTTVDRVEPGRCFAPIVVLDVRERAAHAPELVFTVEDLVEHEGRRGDVAPGSIVVLATGGAQREAGARGGPARWRHAGFAASAIEALVRQRAVVAIGTDAPALDSTSGVAAGAAPSAEALRAALAGGAYVLTNLGRLDALPDGRGVALIAPPLAPVPEAEARVLALVARTVGRGSR